MKRSLFILWAVALTLAVGWNLVVSAANTVLIRELAAASAGSDDSDNSDEVANIDEKTTSGAVFQIVFLGDSRSDSAQARRFLMEVADFAAEVRDEPSIGFSGMDAAKHPDYATQLSEQTHGVFSADDLSSVKMPCLLVIETVGDNVVVRLKMVPDGDGHFDSHAIEAIIRSALHPRRA